MHRWKQGLLAAVMVGGFVSEASAALIVYADRAAFNAAHPGLAVEGFEAVPDLGIVGFAGPLDSATNNGIFSPGDILPGLLIDRENQGGGTEGLVGVGSSAGFGNPSNIVLANFFVDGLDLFFSNSNAVAFDAWSLLGGGTVGVSVFGAGNTLLGSYSVSSGGGFFGVFNNSGAITRINLFDSSMGAEGADDIAFGVASVPEPATLLLFGVGLAAAGRQRLKRRRE